MRIATWNVNSLNVRLPHVLDWLGGHRPDVLMLQETKLTDDRFPVEELRSAGYHAVFSGQKTYNGVAILSREPPAGVIRRFPPVTDEQRRTIAATVAGVRVVNLYVVNGQAVGSEKYDYKLEWLRQVTGHLRTELREHEHVVVAGDFNIAPRGPRRARPRGMEGFDPVQRPGARRPSAPSPRSGSPTPSAGSSSRSVRSPGGTTGPRRSGATAGCESIWYWRRMGSRIAARHAGSTGTPARRSGRPTTPRWSRNSTFDAAQLRLAASGNGASRWDTGVSPALSSRGG